jgi:lysophospholipase L1-like esterase
MQKYNLNLIGVILCLMVALMLPNKLYSSTQKETNDSLAFGDNNIYELYKIYPTNHTNIVMLGDSITYAVNWNELFDYPIINRGINGDTTSGFLQRVEQVTKLNPKKVFVMGGINDIFQGFQVKDIFENHKRIIQILKDKNITPYIYSTLYTAKKDNGYNDKVKELNILLKKYCEDNKIVFIDLNKSLSKDELLIKDYTHDGLHLNAKAYLIWKEEIKKYIFDKK